MSFRLAGPVLGALLVACGDAKVKKEDVEKISMGELAKQTGKPSPAITCPRALEAKVGATMTCAVPFEGKTHDVNVVVTTVDGGSVHFDIEIADEPR
ncbi:MAG: DUF4333 domain-containing protein [Labilithrix sp.]|nr:DUF4333 domain-containing protein [Labilithrix sp.]MCW5815702.1 DUF4333 domain-containing protein [Labilithrix sp.]